MNILPPVGSKCQEASPLSTKTYIPCLKPAICVVIQSDQRNKSVPIGLTMCLGCGDHNVKNRGARYAKDGEVYELAKQELPSPEAMEEMFSKIAAIDTPLIRLRKMADVLKEYQARTLAAADALSKAQAAQSKIELEDMPELMTELGMKEFTLDDGFKIKIESDLKCGITADNKEAAHNWLKDRNFGGLIKVKLEQEYDKGEIEAAEANAVKILELTGKVAVVNETIHAGTLKAFLKEQREKGANLPADLFGIHPFNKAKITPPKEKKKKG